MGEIYRFSAPGRTAISGNHTDHQHGCVLAAAVNLVTVAEVTLNHSGLIRVQSEGYPVVEVSLYAGEHCRYPSRRSGAGVLPCAGARGCLQAYRRRKKRVPAVH